MKSNNPRHKRLQTAAQKPLLHDSSSQTHEMQTQEKSRNINKSLAMENGMLNSIYDNESKNPSQLSQSEQKIKADQNNGLNMSSFNTPMRGAQNEEKAKSLSNSIAGAQEIDNMSPFQLNQQQQKIQEQISMLKDQQLQVEQQQIKSEKIKVAVRVRPFLQKEVGKENVCFVSKNSKQIRVQDGSHTIEASYDRVFPIESGQSDIYNYVSDCIPNLLNGFNCTIFTYGQTGSGKTYTMFGEHGPSGENKVRQQMLESQNLKSSDVFKSRHFSKDGLQTADIIQESVTDAQSKRGVIPRCIAELFQQIKAQDIKVTIFCSFLQIYNEKLFDLLQDAYTQNPLQIREEKIQGIFVEGLSEYVVQDEYDCFNLLQRGQRNRIKRSTKMNMHSSRSHSIFQLLLETDIVDGKGMLKRAKLNLGDLAGSEKVDKTEQMKTKHMLELRNINLSLTTLGKVIQLLSSGQANPHVPFRESKLTRLLQDSLGGNCSTYLIATVSPLMDSIEETISTLKFADRAKCVMQRVRQNEFSAKDDALISKLQREVHYLKQLLQIKKKGQPGIDLSHQLYQLRDENERLRQMAMNFEDIEKMKEENKLMRIELQKLKMISLDSASVGFGDQTPRSNQGIISRIQNLQNQTIESDTHLLKNPAIDNSLNVGQNGKLSDSDDSINEQFNNYKSELNFDVKLDSRHLSYQGHAAGGGQSIQTELLTDRSKFTIPAHFNQESSPTNSSMILNPSDATQKLMQENMAKAKEQSYLKSQKERLRNVIADHQSSKSLDPGITNVRQKHQIIIKKRYKEEDLSDNQDGSLHRASDNGNITLPAINEAQIKLSNDRSGLNKLDIQRKSSNNEIFRQQNNSQINPTGQGNSQSPYMLNRSNLNPLQNKNETYLSDFTNPIQNPINKYPSRQNHMLRRSIEYNHNQNAPGSTLSQAQSDVNQSYQVNSSGMIGLTTQSSLYGGVQLHSQKAKQSNHFHQYSQYSDSKSNNSIQKPPYHISKPRNPLALNQTTLDAGDSSPHSHLPSAISENNLSLPPHLRTRDKSPLQLQTMVRIRGRHNQVLEGKGSVLMTMDEEKKIQDKKRQLKRSNDRLRMLESMEVARKEKIEAELGRLIKDKEKREEDELRKRELIKQRKIMSSKIDDRSQD